MADEKDRLGDMLQDKGHADEERYFQEQDRLRIERLRKKQEVAQRADRLGLCPRCGTRLVEMQVDGVDVDRCPEDCGMFLDRGEMEKITERMSDSWLFRLFHPRKGN
jgi:hypothetical protein